MPLAGSKKLVCLSSGRLTLAGLVILVILSACQGPVPDNPPPQSIVGSGLPPETISAPTLPVGSNALEFDHVTLEQGLSQSTINTIIQDEQGFMWFATNNGLNRYDGYEITVFRHDPSDARSLIDNHIQALLTDSAGMLWVGTMGGGLDQYDPVSERFVHYRHDPDDKSSISSDFIYSIQDDRRGDLWIGTLNGLNHFDPDTGRFTLYQNDYDPADDSISTNLIFAIHEDQDGLLWLGTAGRLIGFDPGTGEFIENPVAGRTISEPVTAFYEDSDGYLWIGTLTNGVYRYDSLGKDITILHNSPVNLDSLSNNTVRSISQDKSGNVWIATDGGLNRMAPSGSGFIHERHDPNRVTSLSEDMITSLYIDESGIVWAGTFTGGLNKFDPYKAKFQHVRSDPNYPDNSLSNNLVLSFLEDSSGDLWVGTLSGLNRIDKESGDIELYTVRQADPHSIADSVVGAMLEDQNRDIWFATFGGLSRYIPETNDFVSFRYDANDPESLNFPAVVSLFEDSKGDFWIGTAGGGFDKLDRESGTFTHYEFDDVESIDNVGPDNIRSFFEDEAGNFWIGTMAGLAKFDRESGDIVYHTHDPDNPDSISDNYILTIHEDSSGSLWIGTQNGLNRLVSEAGVFDRYLWDEGLPDNVVYGILEDDLGNMWISSNRGISRFTPSTGVFHNYDTGDGLQALEFNVGAFYKNARGEMFFGGINGFNVFHPEDISDNPYIPPIIVTSFQILNQQVEHGEDSRIPQPVSLLETIELKREDTSISFELAALHYSSPEDNQYAYIMEGFDEDWNYIGDRRHATYTNLPPGEYTFKAIGTNSDGVWNQEGTAIKVIMPYPFWRTWWFLLMTGIVLAAAIYGAYRLRTRNIEARTRELEVQVASRTSEIERRREIAEGLREILVILNSNRSLEESLHYIVDQAARLTEAEDAIIIRQEEDGEINIVATNQGGQIRYTPGAALLAITREWMREDLQVKRQLIMPDLENYWSAHPEVHPSALLAHRAILGVTLYLGDEIYGGLLMFYTDKRTFSADDRELGTTFADQATLAIANDRLRAQAEETAVATERNRLARDLHDAVTQTLFSASLIAETLPLIYDNDLDQGQKLLQELRQLTRGALAEMRTLLLELRPIALEESELPDLLLQLTEAVTGRTGIPISTSIESTCQLPTPISIAFYRIAQESLNNVMKHARASTVEVVLKGCADGEIVSMTVSDDGRGFDTASVSLDRMGLKIIRERAQAIEAELTITSAPGKGTRVKVTWKTSTEKLERNGNG